MDNHWQVAQERALVVERLRVESSRGAYAPMVRLALALYDAGLGHREVLRECYGVDLPEEFFVMVEAEQLAMSLLIEYTYLPWDLAFPPKHGGLESELAGPHLDDIERKIFACDPDLLPLGQILNLHSRWYGLILCYRKSVLAVGQTEVFGIAEEVRPQDEAVPCGESLLAVLYDHHADVLRGLTRQYNRPSNRGAGSISLEELAGMRLLLERVEELQHLVAAKASGSGVGDAPTPEANKPL